MLEAQQKPKVYRARNFPAYVDRASATHLLVTALNEEGIAAGDIEISSLATTVEHWKRYQTKVATLTLSKTPACMSPNERDSNDPKLREWRFRVPGLPEPLILDLHFHGFTVLNEVALSEHQYDCIAISGLASHPFGSWQPKGVDKSYMWIRDALPVGLPGIRFITYGYDTTLADSKSFQNIVDLARTLNLELEAYGWGIDNGGKPLLFLAHSLGGVILKQALVILADGTNRAGDILDSIRGIVFFGTPSVGMPLSNLLALVEHQPNKDLVETLSDRSNFLENLEVQFRGISFVGRITVLWAYETETSPTIMKNSDGSYSRLGPRSVMVDRQSATSGRYLFDASSTIQIDEDHSHMVKFTPDDRRVSILISKVGKICWPKKEPIHSNNEKPAPGFHEAVSSRDNPQIAQLTRVKESPDGVYWDHDLFIYALRPPERDNRLEQIEKNFGHTFHWAFENSSIGLSDWLSHGSGIFWVSGKPGSGKSTFMKFLLHDPRMTELLGSRKWKSSSTQIVAEFFFHFRGTALQKSFQGLMRSLLSRFLEEEPRLRSHVVGEIIKARLQEHQMSDMHRNLSFDVQEFFQHYGVVSLDHPDFRRLQEELVNLLASQPGTQLISLLKDIASEMGFFKSVVVKCTLLGEFSCLAKCPPEKLAEEIDRIQDLLPWVGSSKLKLLIRTWHLSIHTRKLIRDFLENKRLYRRSIVQIEESEAARREIAKHRRYESYISKLANCQHIYHQERIDFHLAPWTNLETEKGIRSILGQDMFELDCCLIFDALDEYDGRPEVICEFLKDLIARPTNTKTTVKILFSSRPWPVFRREFSSCNGFEIHEHTRGDMQEYCSSLLPSKTSMLGLILPLIRDILDRARGVFLWVKLVMKDMALIMNSNDELDADISMKLRLCLDSLPDELEDYYSAIVRRVPWTFRTETYVLLECLAKSSKEISVERLQMLMETGCTPSLAKHEVTRDKLGTDERSELDMYIRTISGGLAEIVGDGSWRGSVIQLMHQTCRDWIESSPFKYIALEDAASMMWENGHSFLVKFYTLLWLRDRAGATGPEILDHIKQAERTTGVSQFDFMTRLPPAFYSMVSPSQARPITSELSFAISNGLWLYLQDFVQQDALAISKTTEPLLSAMLRTTDRQIVGSGRALSVSQSSIQGVDVGSYLLENGYRLENDTHGVFKLMKLIWESQDRHQAEHYLGLVEMAVEKSLPPDFTFEGSFDASLTSSKWTILHLSPPSLAELLLKRGAAVNGKNSLMQTPLDYALATGSVHHACAFGLEWLYKSACLLVEHGGVLQNGSSYDVHSSLKNLKDAGFDIGPLSGLQVQLKDDRLHVGLVSQEPSTGLVQHDLFAIDSTANSQSRFRKRDWLKRRLRLE
ncbi:Protein SERAC1 [Paramyrothecium foliicola]|nr:Protein SERAC1 [Paramyrothecium foliicola]